jgi:hypothetical protein
MIRRLIGLALTAILLVAGVLASTHGHLAADHERPCASCVAAEARATGAPPPLVLPTRALTRAAPLPIRQEDGRHGLPPLLAAPKHGPPASA